MSKTVLITGSSGYVGHLTIEELRSQKLGLYNIIALDVRDAPAENRHPDVTYITGDIRSKELVEIVKKYGVETVVHLASIVTPGDKSNREFEYSVDVLGTENVLNACKQNNVQKLIVTSSGAAYGYYADNPELIQEDHDLRGNEEFAYAHHKKLVEHMLLKIRKSHPDLKQLVLRPGVVLGASTNNQITDLFEKPFVVGVSGSDIPFVFIWEMDVVKIIVKGITEENEGVYNLAGDGCLTMRQIAQKLGKPYLNIPPTIFRAILSMLKQFGLTQYGPEQLDFLRYRPVLSNENLKAKFGYTPTYTSTEVFDLYLNSRV